MFDNLLREPLVHFLIIGAALFGLYAVTADDKDTEAITISAGDIERLRAKWLGQSDSAAATKILNGLIESEIQKEVLFREAKRLGLDENDTIVRRRMIQKMRFLSANMSQLRIPGDAALLEYFNNNKELYRAPEKRSFTHIYFNHKKRGAYLAVDVAAVLQALTADEDPKTTSKYGDNFILQSDYKERSHARVAQLFGADFADALFAVDKDAWHGPLQSAYGTHLVRIQNVRESYLPEFSAIKEKLSDDLMRRQLGDLKKKSYQEMRRRYEVNIEYE